MNALNYPQRFYRLTRPLVSRLSPAKRLLIMVGVALLLGAMAMLAVQRRQRIVHYGYDLSRLVKERDALAEDLRALQVERAVLAAPDRVRRLAQALGMRPPATNEVLAVPYRGPELQAEAP